MRECFDEGILQSYLDGELSRDRMESVASHLSSCFTCTSATRELESGAELLASVLAPEFESSVPSERLRHRIDAAIAGLQVVSSAAEPVAARSWFQSVVDLFTFSPARSLGYASLAVVLAFAAIMGVVQLRRSPAVSNSNNEIAVNPPSIGGGNQPAKSAGPTSSPEQGHVAEVPVAPVHTPSRGQKRIPNPSVASVAKVQLLPGEKSYLKTIAALDSTIKANGNRPMRPALQAEYERNLALVDRALAAARNAAKSNPNDPETQEFVYSAYQSKVDLLSTVADARLYNRDH